MVRWKRSRGFPYTQCVDDDGVIDLWLEHGRRKREVRWISSASELASNRFGSRKCPKMEKIVGDDQRIMHLRGKHSVLGFAGAFRRDHGSCGHVSSAHRTMYLTAVPGLVLKRGTYMYGYLNPVGNSRASLTEAIK